MKNEDKRRWFNAMGKEDIESLKKEVATIKDIKVQDMQEGFEWACANGKLKTMKWFMEWGVDIHQWSEKGLFNASANGQLEVVKYLTADQEVLRGGGCWANHRILEDCVVRVAMQYGKLEVVKYLTTDQKLKESENGVSDPLAFKAAGIRAACNNNHWNVVKWLVLDYRVEKTLEMKEIMEDYPQVDEYFRVREEMDEMQNELNRNEGEEKEVKTIRLPIKL